MKCKNFFTLCAVILFAAWSLLLLPSDVRAQGGNSINGMVFGLERAPVAEANVELLDEYGRLVQRQRTDGSGRYFFNGMPQGRYTVRVIPYQTDYEEAEQTDEIINLVGTNQSGQRTTRAFQNLQMDFYLRLRKGVAQTTGIIFAQDVPAPAKKLYEKAVENLNNKKEKEGLAGLKAAIEAFPDYYIALERLGTQYVQLKHYEAAAILLNRAVTINPRSFRSWYGLAYSLNSLNQRSDALTAVQKALEIYTESPDALVLSGILLRQNKKFPESEKNLQKAIEVSKNKFAVAHWHLALLYGNDMKRYSDAAKELKIYLKMQPDLKDIENIKSLIKEFEEKAAKS